MAKVKGSFVVIPSQFDIEADEAVQGYAFPTAGKAQSFAESLQKVAKRLAAKALGIDLKTDEGKAKFKEMKQGCPVDILIQRLDASGQPDGDPMEFDQLRD